MTVNHSIVFSLISALFFSFSFSAIAAYQTPAKTIELHHQPLSYHSLGTPQKGTILLLGGGPGFSSWNLQPIQQLTSQAGYQTILMDMAGIGENQHITPEAYLAIWKQQIHRTLQQENAKPIILIGHSWGALMAMLYARAYPQQIEKLILMSPVDPDKQGMRFITKNIHLRNLKENNIAWDDESAWDDNPNALPVDPKQMPLKQINTVMPAYFYDYQQGVSYAKKFSKDDLNVQINWKAWQEYDKQRIDYKTINGWTFPIYFLGCRQDILMPNNLNAMQAKIRFAKVSVLPKCGHFPWVEQPELFNKTLLDYLQ